MERSAVYIDRTQLQKNLSIYMDYVRTSDIMAVVKADAYGHGDIAVASFLQQCGIANFAVSNYDEAIRLRKNGIEGQILILGYTPVDLTEGLYKNNITQALLSKEYAERLADQGYPIKAHFAIDTGMRRIGLDARCPDQCEKIIRQFGASLNITGLFTHLCSADMPEKDERDFTNYQITLFKDVCRRISDLKLPYLHYLNSAGGLFHSDGKSMIRLGIILYGLKPSHSLKLPEGILPVLQWKSVVTMVKVVQVGDTISYGRTYRAERLMKIATVATGYADGYRRDLSNIGYVLIKGKRAKIVGRICMDQMMVDVTDIEGVDIDTEVILIGKSGCEEICIDDVADSIGTIGYELVCSIGKRVKRIYI